jgi:chain length determinant protein EpsF
MSLQQLLSILRGRWRIAFSIFAAVMVAAVVISIVSPKQYIASASVVVDVRSDNVADAVYPGQPSSYLATQVDIIESEGVAQRVVRALKFDQSPEFQRKWQQSTSGKGDFGAWLADNLRRSLSVNPARDSNVITIAVKAPDRKTAAVLANAFARAYIDTNIELKVEPAKQYASWYDDRYRALRADLEAKQKLLSDYQTEHEIMPAGERLNTESTRLAELSSQLVAIQGQRQDSQSRQGQVFRGNDALPEVLQNALIASLKGDLARTEAKQQEIATRLGSNHPDYLSNKAEIDSLHARILQESSKIGASLGTTTQIDLQREREIGAALETQKKQILDLVHQRDEAANLQNDVQAAQRNLDAVSQRLAQSSLESQTQQANIVLLTPAAEPAKYSSPNYKLNLALGVFLGSIIAIGSALLLEMTDQRVRSDNELLQLLGVPLLGKIGSITSGKRVVRVLTPALGRLGSSASGP